MKKLLLLILPKGVRARLFLLISLILLPLVLLLAWNYYQRYEVRRNTEIQMQLEVAEVTAANFQIYIDSIRRQAQVTGKAIITFEPYTREKAGLVLSDMVSRYYGVRNMSWVGQDGIVLASSEPGFVGSSLAYRQYFQDVVHGGKEWALGDLTETGTFAPRPTVALAAAIKDEFGVLRGVVVAGIEPDRLDEVVMDRTRPAEGSYAFFDSKGVLVFRCPQIEELDWPRRTGWIDEDELLRRALQTKQNQVGIVKISMAGSEPRISARVYMPQIGWVAGTGRPVDVAFGVIWRGLAQDAMIAAAVCIIAFLLAYIFSTTISEPIVHLQGDAQKMGQGVLRKVEETYAPYEVQNLRHQVEEMATSLIQRARQLAEATNDLKTKNEELESIVNITSHDLKSPVVNIMGFSGELDRSLAALKERLLENRATGCQSEDIMHVLDGEIPEEMEFIRKSTRSIDQMLQSLSKAVHVVLTEIHIQRVNANALIASVMTGFEERLRKEHVDCTVEPLPDCQADPALLKEVFFNIIENAITYLMPERAGKITIGGSVRNQYTIYFVKDNGRGIDPAHQHNIFKLFHKLDVSEQGEGIGLTVSKRLIERQSGNLWVESEPGVGSTFFIALPKA